MKREHRKSIWWGRPGRIVRGGRGRRVGILFNIFCIALGWMACGGGVARADILATEQFNYVDGPLSGNNGGTGWWYAWNANTLSMSVAQGQAITTAPGNPPLYGIRGFLNPESTPDLFIAFDITTNDVSLGDYFGATSSVGVNNPQLTFGKFAGDPTWALGNNGAVSTGIAILPHTTYRLVAAYHSEQVGVDFSMLWVNPTAADFFDPTGLTSSADAVSFAGVFGSSFDLTIFSGLPGVRFDNIVISNDPIGVGLRSTPIPEPRLLELVSLGLLAAWALNFRTRRSPAHAFGAVK